MAGAVLATVGGAVGSALLPGLGTFLGAPIGGMIGSTLGSVAGSFIDQAIFAPTVKGNRISQVQITSSTEGSPITRLYGVCRLGGQMIWATRFKESKSTQSSGGKGGPKTTNYTYSVSFAVAFCEGSARTTLGRVWADGNLLDLSKFTYRFYPGSETQTPDSLIESIEGSANTSAYRGTAYLVFENMPLTDYGNRIPQITAEVTRPIEASDGAYLLIQGVNLIPATGSFTLSDDPYLRILGPVESVAENIHTSSGRADLLESLDQLDASLPNCDTVSLVVAWFGDDLRCGSCQIKPRIGIASADRAGAVWLPQNWSVAGLGATDVDSTSIVNGANAFGSTPDDNSVIAAITELRSRGKRIIFYPFVLMDIPADNGLPDPYGGIEQAVYPWRGRITCSPAPGQPATPDKTATAATQVNAFFTTTWGYENFITHYANLCATAGGVDAFLIGSEMVGLTQVRSSSSAYPAVTKLIALAATVKGILPASLVSYAADWSEYHSHRPTDGSGDVYFNLDPLWADANIDFIGVDNYLPLTDWRQDDTQSIYDLGNLKSGIESGEFYDWYYASDADRISKTRSAITDGAYNKPWVYRNKDLRNWWRNLHYDRPAGVESGSSSAWTVGSKPFWFTEFGCPAVNAGTNQPNVFHDAKSSESAFPYFSSGARDDLIQAQYLRAMLEYWTDNGDVTTGGEGTVEYTTLLAALGREAGDVVGINLVTAVKTGYTFLSSRFPSTYGAHLYAGGTANGEVDLYLFRTGGSIPTDYSEEYTADSLMAGDFLDVAFTDDPGQAYQFIIRQVKTRYRFDYGGSNILVLIIGCDLGNYAGSGGTITGKIVQPENMIVWTWDARPYPAFPQLTQVWSDGVNYSTGHWINGRIGAAVNVGNLIREICTPALATNLIDTSLVVGPGLNITGYYASQISSPRDDLAPLLSLYSIDCHESDGLLKFVQRAQAQTIVIDPENLIITDQVAVGYSIKKTQAYDLPGRYNLSYVDQQKDYQPASVAGNIEGGNIATVAAANYPIVLSEAAAKAIAGTLIYSAWISQQQVTTSLPPSYAMVEAGDVIRLGSQSLAFRVSQAHFYGQSDLQGEGCEPTIYDLSLADRSAQNLSGTPTFFGPALLEIMDLPIIVSTEPTPQYPKLATAATPWSGGTSVYQANGSGGFDLLTTVNRQSIIGELTEALPAGRLFSWDRSGRIKVKLYQDDTLSSVTETDVTNGANIIAIESPSGLWEVAQFAIATLTGADAYTLTDLLRGRFGTEQEMLNAPYPIGSRVVFFDDNALGELPVPTSQRGVTQAYRYGPQPYPQDHQTYKPVNFTTQCVGLRPYAPTQLRLDQDGADLTLFWVRRTRLNGDDLDGNTPLNEDTERYEVEILSADGSAVLRTVTGLGAPGWRYVAADQTTDFGAPQTSVRYRVYQISATIGRGVPGTYP